MIILKHAIFIVFLLLQIVFGFLCLFGPFIAATQTPIQSFLKFSLLAITIFGPILTFNTYVRWMNAGKLPWFVSGGILDSFLEKATFFHHPWICFISPSFLLLSILLAGCLLYLPFKP